MSTQPAENPDPPSSTASEVWLLMSDLVLDHTPPARSGQTRWA